MNKNEKTIEEDGDSRELVKPVLGEMPDPVDVNVGRRIKVRRMMLKMSQKELAELIGVTFQQIQKYESAANRVSASSLYGIAGALGQPVTFFFEGLGEGAVRLFKNKMEEGMELAEKPAKFDDPMSSPMSLELLHAFWRIKSENKRQKAYELVLAISQTD